jgi:hypothetical protein
VCEQSSQGRVSLIRIEKSKFSQSRKIKARLTLLQQATENSKEGKTFRTNDQERNQKTQKHKNSMNNSASLTPVQGPSTVG